MSHTIRGALLAVVAAAAGTGLAVAVGSAGADTKAGTTTTLGSTTGTPNQNICVAGITCTYIPFNGVANPGLQVPFDGTVTSFSVNSGSATGAVELRVLRPAGNGQFTGAGTSPAQTLAAGPNTFTASLPVKAGDVLALDNSTSALMFDDSSASPITAYYQPGLADGSTAAPNNNKTGFRLLLSATVVSSGTTTSGATTTTGANGTVTVTTTAPARPVIGNPTQAHKTWRRSGGTTFAFGLSTTAKVLFVFRRHVGRRKLTRGTVAMNGHPGTDRLRFKGRVAGGKRLKPGNYTVTITATNKTGISKPVSLSFKITR